LNPFNAKDEEWYDPSLDLEHTISCVRVKGLTFFLSMISTEDLCDQM